MKLGHEEEDGRINFLRLDSGDCPLLSPERLIFSSENLYSD